jgi:hypothetical protein
MLKIHSEDEVTLTQIKLREALRVSHEREEDFNKLNQQLANQLEIAQQANVDLRYTLEMMEPSGMGKSYVELASDVQELMERVSSLERHLAYRLSKEQELANHYSVYVGRTS